MYIDTITGRYPMGERDIRAAHPDTSFPRPFRAPTRYAPVFPAPRPAHDAVTEGVRETDPAVNASGVYEQRWEVYALGADAVAANVARLQQRVLDEVVANTQKRLDDFASGRQYDGILSACTYATSAVPKFAAEGQYAVAARDSTWAALYGVLAEVQAGTRPLPSGYADVEASLPALVWPQE